MESYYNTSKIVVKFAVERLDATILKSISVAKWVISILFMRYNVIFIYL